MSLWLKIENLIRKVLGLPIIGKMKIITRGNLKITNGEKRKLKKKRRRMEK